MKFALDPRSVQNLHGVHPDLLKVLDACIADWDQPFKFGISEGLRTLAQEEKYKAAGRSQTLKSRHLDGHAFDVVALLPDMQVVWTWHLYDVIADHMKAAAAKVNIPIQWGGDWKTLRDGCHFQLPWEQYPSEPPAETKPA